MKTPTASTFLPCLLAIGALLPGCGGGGGLLGPSGASLNLAQSHTQINYGESVTISWNSNDLTRIVTDKTNIRVAETMVNGSLVDTPSQDTTYTIVGRTANGDELSRSVTVVVAKSTKQIAIVADSAVAGVPQMREFVQALTMTPVTVSTGIPTLTGVDVVVMLESASVGPADIPTIQAFLNLGGSVVLAGRSPAKLATGNIAGHDLSAIGSWFAGVTSRYGAGGIPRVVDTSPVGFPLSTVIIGDDIHVNSNLTVATVSASAFRLTDPTRTECGGFGYKPSSGGKVGFVSAAPIGATREEMSLRYLMLTICRWAADGS